MRWRALVYSLLLTSFACLAAAQDSLPRFEVASIRPNTGSDPRVPPMSLPPDGMGMFNTPLGNIIRYAYGVQAFRVIGAPGWTEQERFDIEAKATGTITDEQRRLMLRSLLADRFQLRARLEPREQTVYVVTAARTAQLGPGMTPRPDCAQAECTSAANMNPRAGMAQVRAWTIDNMARGIFSNVLNQVVYDESGIRGSFDAELSWRPDGTTTDPNDARPSFFTAVEEQLGLRLTPQRRPVEVLVIENVSRPNPN